MINKKLKIGKRSLAHTLIIFFVMTAVITASAWFADNSGNQPFQGDSVTVKAANINAEYSVDINYYINGVTKPTYLGVPGEYAIATFTLTDKSSTRDYVYKIDLGDNFVYDSTEEKIYIISEDGEYGVRILGEAVLPDDSGVYYVDSDGAFYGIMEIKNLTDIITGASFEVRLDFYGEEVLELHPLTIGTSIYAKYDGNITMDYKFDASAVKVTYCQATPAAVLDVFELNLTMLPYKLSELGGG